MTNVATSPERLRAMEKLAQDIAATVAIRGYYHAAGNQVARLGLYLREWYEAMEIEAACLDFRMGDPEAGAVIPLPAFRMRRALDFLDRHRPCWDAPVLFPPDAAGNKHTWTQHPRATATERIHGWHRVVCAVCGVEGAGDTSG